MSISLAIRSAVESRFGPEDQKAILDVFETITQPANGSPLIVQGACLVLGNGDSAMVKSLAAMSIGDARDLLYYLESPEKFEPGLTRKELARRFEEFGLSAPFSLSKDDKVH